MDRFSPKHYLFLMMSTGIVAMKTYPAVFIGDAGRDSWAAVILSSVLIAAYFIFAVTTLQSDENVNFLQVYQKAFGKPAGAALIVLFAATLLLTLIECACVQADGMHQNMLLETPNWYFILFFVLPALYIVRKDLVAVVITSIIGIVLIFIAGLNLSLLTLQQKSIERLFPIFTQGVTPAFWQSVLKSLGMYGALTITLPYLSRITYKRTLLRKYTVIGLVIILQMQIVSITGIYMTFDPIRAASYYYPKLIQTHLVSYFEILEFGELYVMLQMMGGWLLKYVVAFHALVQLMRDAGFKNRTVSIACFVITGFVLSGSFYASYTSIRLFYLLDIFPWITLVNFIVLPALAFILYRIKRKKSVRQIAS